MNAERKIPTQAPANPKAIAPAPAAVVNIPPGPTIYALGRINTTLHIYNVGQPGGGNTTYDLTIINVGHFPAVVIQPGHTDSYNPAGNAVYIQNSGPSNLQALY